jgi:hypothetical protein
MSINYKKQIKMICKTFKLSVLMLGLGITVQAQQATTAAGGDATGSGGTIGYSIGQVVYSTHTGSNGTLSQGVQQAYEIFTLGFEDTELKISLSVFPNPTVNNLTLQISDYNNEKLSYQLYNMQGKMLNNGDVTAQQTEIKTSSLAPAMYFITVVNQENKKVQSFKIIKK